MISLKTIMNTIIPEIHSGNILRDVSTFWGFRSTVPGSELQKASQFLRNSYQENVIQVAIHPYPADNGKNPSPGQRIDDIRPPYAWFPRSAVLEIFSPAKHTGVICSFAQEPLCLVSNSVGTPAEGITTEVVVVGSGTTEADYSGIDVKGKIVLVNSWSGSADALARKNGAVGLVSDSVTPPWLYNLPPVRSGLDVPDLTMWSTLSGYGNEQPLWGFNLTPRQGAKLREIIATSTSPVLLRACIDADLKEGTSDMVNAFLPGSDLADEEIWIFTHSSEPGALDNASGCCAAIEIARAIKTLVDKGLLPPPRRSIRFLSAVETFGYLPYIAERFDEIGKIKAAIAVDSIGQDFRQGGGVLKVCASPDYNPSFIDDLLFRIFELVAAESGERFSAEPYEQFLWLPSPFFPNNDNMLADGYFNVPTSMICCWPDKFYHSNLDTLDKLSAGSIDRTTVSAAVYIYYLASAGEEETRWMAELSLRGWKQRILQNLEHADPQSNTSRQILLRAQDALESINKFYPSLQPAVAKWQERLESFWQHEILDSCQTQEKETESIVSGEMLDMQPSEPVGKIKPLRWHFPGAGKFSPTGQEQFNAIKAECPTIETVWYLLNGERDAGQICQRSEHPSGAVIRFLRLLRQEKLVEWVA